MGVCDEVSLVEEVACWKGLGAVTSKRESSVRKAAECVLVLKRQEFTKI